MDKPSNKLIGAWALIGIAAMSAGGWMLAPALGLIVFGVWSFLIAFGLSIKAEK